MPPPPVELPEGILLAPDPFVEVSLPIPDELPVPVSDVEPLDVPEVSDLPVPDFLDFLCLRQVLVSSVEEPLMPLFVSEDEFVPIVELPVPDDVEVSIVSGVPVVDPLIFPEGAIVPEEPVAESVLAEPEVEAPDEDWASAGAEPKDRVAANAKAAW